MSGGNCEDSCDWSGISTCVSGGVSSSGVATSGIDSCAKEGLGAGGVVLYSSDKPGMGNVSCATVGGGACDKGAFGTG